MYAERGLFSAKVSWNKPVATDNSGVPPTVTSNYQPLQRLHQGTHVIIYTAVDQSGNNATCSFTFTVTGNKKSPFSLFNFPTHVVRVYRISFKLTDENDLLASLDNVHKEIRS